jgi:K+-transporting ATPase ATPase C chain
MLNHLRPALVLTAFFVVVTGLAFPLAVTGVAQVVFPHQANGSLVRDAKGNPVGSELIGQPFSGPGTFHPRPSAAGTGYDAANSSGTNLGPTSEKLISGVPDDPATEADETYPGVKQLATNYRRENGLPPDVVLPADAVTRSASGLDPHVSVRNAELQAERVAKARGLRKETVLGLIREARQPALFGVFGESRVNVLELNRALERVR